MTALDDMRPDRQIRIIGFDPESLTSLDNPNLDSLVVENTRKMGAEAVRLIIAKLHGQGGPAVTQFEPVLVTRENVNSAEVRELTSMDWRPEPLVRTWRVVQ